MRTWSSAQQVQGETPRVPRSGLIVVFKRAEAYMTLLLFWFRLYDELVMPSCGGRRTLVVCNCPSAESTCASDAASELPGPDGQPAEESKPFVPKDNKAVRLVST